LPEKTAQTGPRSEAPPLRPADGSASSVGEVIRWGLYSIAVNGVLICLHGFTAWASGSLAVTAELVHNFADLASAGAVVVGLKLALHKSRAFPYGLYKVENLIAVGLSIMIFFTAFEVAATVISDAQIVPSVDFWMLAVLAVTMVIPLVFSRFEMRVAERTHSPALRADAQEYRVHAYTTGLAFTALLSAWFEFPLDRVAAAVIIIAVVKTGWDILIDALRVLLDASIDLPSADRIRAAIAADPAVTEVTWITGRNAGRFRFVEAGVVLRSHRLDRPEAAIARIERTVREAMPQIERVLLHVETATSDSERVAVPVTDLSGTISAHFGEAPFFAFLTLDRKSHAVEDQRIRANPHLAESRAKGLRVAEWLVDQKVDRVLVPRDFEGRGPAYVFREAGIQVEVTSEPTLAHLFGTGTETPET